MISQRFCSFGFQIRLNSLSSKNAAVSLIQTETLCKVKDILERKSNASTNDLP